jgi:hypothetical protein
MRERRGNEREQRKAHMASNASASSAEATTLAPTPATVPHIQRKAKCQEKKAVREALFAAKQAGDQNAVQEVCWHLPLSTFYSFLFSYVRNCSNYDNNVLRIE